MPTINLNRPAIDAGQISAADLEAARQHSTGRVLHLRRVHIAGRDTCSGRCETASGCDCTPATVPVQPAEACTELGADAAESMLRHRRVKATAGLALLLAVVGFVIRLVWPLG